MVLPSASPPLQPAGPEGIGLAALSQPEGKFSWAIPAPEDQKLAQTEPNTALEGGQKQNDNKTTKRAQAENKAEGLRGRSRGLPQNQEAA